MVSVILDEPPDSCTTHNPLQALRIFPSSENKGRSAYSSIIRSPLVWGRQKGTPICSDFPVFFRFVPMCAPCFRECPDLFRYAPFLPICSDLFSEQIRTNQGNSFLPTPFTNPRIMCKCQGFCKRWFPNGGSSFVRRANPGIPFNLNVISVLPHFASF